MKAIIVTARGHEHAFVTKLLIEALGNNLSGIVIERGVKPASVFTSMQKISKRYNVITIFERIITKGVRKVLRFDRRQHIALDSILGHSSFDKIIPKNIQVIEPETVNSNEAVKWIENINPHFIFVYGTGIVGKTVLSLPSVQALNLHTGISPYYRGSASGFWALYNKDPLMIGATVHKCTSEVDGGDIYGRISVRLLEGDEPFLAFARSVSAGAKLYADIAKRLIDGARVPFIKQDYTVGKEYLFIDKTFFHDIKMEGLIFFGGLNKIIISAQNKPLPYPDDEQGDQFSVK